MRCQGRERGLIDCRKECGRKVLILAARPYIVPRFCDRWECERCHKFKSGELQRELRNSSLAVTVWVQQAERMRSKTEEKKLSNFVTRKISGPFWKILSDASMMLIATKPFPGSARRDTKKTIDDLVPAILSESWTITPTSKPKRVTRRRGQRVPKEKNSDSSYAEWTGSDQLHDKAGIAFSNLKTDHERAGWLIKRERAGQVVLSRRGAQIVLAYQSAQ